MKFRPILSPRSAAVLGILVVLVLSTLPGQSNSLSLPPLMDIREIQSLLSIVDLRTCKCALPADCVLPIPNAHLVGFHCNNNNQQQLRRQQQQQQLQSGPPVRETFCCSRRPRGAPLELPANLRSMVGSSASRAAMAFLPAQLRDRVQQQIRTVPAVQVSPAQPKMPRQSGNPAGKEEEMPANIAPEEKEEIQPAAKLEELLLEEEGAREKIRIKVEASEALVKTAAAPPKNEDVSDQAATEKDSEDVSSSSSNHKNASEEDVEDENEAGEVDPCPCVADQECSPDRMDFTFGKSCSFGHVRCCPAEKEDTGARETVINIHDQEEGHFEEDRRKSQNTPKVDLPYQVVPRDEEEAEATKDGPGFAFTRHFVPKHQPTIGSMIPNVLGKDAFTFPSLVTGGAPSRLPMDPELKQDGPVSSEPMADEEQVKKSDDFDKNSNPSPVQHRVAFPDSSQSTLILPNRVIDGISPRNPIRVTQQQLLTFPRPHPQLFAPELKRGDHMSPKPLATDKQEKNSNDNMVEHRLNPTQEQTNLPDSPPRSQNMPMRVYSGIPHIRQQQQFPSSRPHTQFVPEQKRANLNPPRPHTPQFDPEQKQDNQVSPGLPANDDKPQISNENNLSKSIDPAPQKVTYPDSSQRNPQHPVRVHYGISPGNPPQSTPPRQFPSVRPHPQVIVPPVGNGFKMAPLRPPVFVNRVSSDVPEPHQPSSPTREAPKSADGPTAAVDDAGSDPELERRRYHEMLARRQMAAEQEMMRIRNANHRDSIQRSQAEPVSFMGRLNKAIFSLGKGFQDLIG